MVIQPPNQSSSNPNLPNTKPCTMQRQGGFFGKSRHAPVSAIDIKRNNANNDQPTNHRPPGVGPENTTGGNMMPHGNANLTPLGKPGNANLTPLGKPGNANLTPLGQPGTRQNLGSNDTQPQITAPISHETSQPALKPVVNAQQINDASQRAGHEAADKERDANRPRKSVMRKTVDHNSSFLSMLERRVWQRDFRDKHALQPDVLSYPEMVPPIASRENTSNAVTTRFVKTATNKMRCPIFTLAWTPEGRRLITGASSGEFTLWNGLTFNFETILQAHDSPVRAMKWSHNDTWMVTGDHGGYIKYWQSNMNNVKMFQAHKEPVRDVSFSPTDTKFASCSDDGTVRVWDFFSCREERVLRGHGADVKCVDWHPTQGLLASGSKDNQQPIKIWEPKSGAVLTTIHAHKSTVMDVRWNPINGNWLLTASRDHLIKLFDIRNTKEEVQTFRGHKKEASAIAWHPIHEGVFSSGGSDGAIMFWSVGSDKETGAIETAHESIVWSLAWHPIGHILCSGSNDHTCKYWTRNRPGDTMRDKYNLNTLPFAQEHDDIATSGIENQGTYANAVINQNNRPNIIPGMAPEDRVPGADDHQKLPPHLQGFNFGNNIPGLDRVQMDEPSKKVPYAKPIPKNFQNSWNHDLGPSQNPMNNMQGPPGPFPGGGPPPMGHMMGPPTGGMHPNNMNVGPPNDNDVMSLQELQRQATAVVAFGNVYPVLPGSNLYMSILQGEMNVKDVLRSEFMT